MWSASVLDVTRSTYGMMAAMTVVARPAYIAAMTDLLLIIGFR